MEFDANLTRAEEIKTILETVKAGTSAAIYDTCDGQRAFLAALLSRRMKRKILLITSSQARAGRLAEDIGAYLEPEGTCRVFQGREQLFLRGTGGREGLPDMLRVLRQVREGSVDVLVCPAEAVLTCLWDPARIASAALCLAPGDSVDRAAFLARLVSLGYKPAAMAEGPGQFAQRGDIVDVFPGEGGAPLRFEFFGDDLDLIRSFDPVTQRSVERINRQVRIDPAYPAILEKGEPGVEKLEALVRRAVSGFDAQLEPEKGIGLMQELERLRVLKDTGVYRSDPMKWAGVLGWQRRFIWDYFPEPPLVLADEGQWVSERWRDRQNGFLEDLRTSMERGDAVGEWACSQFTRQEALEALGKRQLLLLEGLLRGLGGFRAEKLISFPGKNGIKYYGRMDTLAEDVRIWRREGIRFWFCAAGESRQERLRNTLSQYNIDLDSARELAGINLSQGFSFAGDRFRFLAMNDLYGSAARKAGREKKKLTRRLEAFTDLAPGDYVVHENFGIGIFQGTVRLQTDGVWQDYFLIRYQGADKLYVPVDQFERVQKYMAGDAGGAPPLDSLNSSKWEKQQKKVRGSLKKLAFDLVQLYARRQATPGYAFQPDSPWQRQFEDAFPYELTADQEQAVEEIKTDMEKPLNMDRLLCGDVGFGKTEVALRAAFKCILSGKQAALLCPTTVLCQQHFHTVQNRFRDFPVRIESLSRFRTAREQKKVLADLKAGNVDIVIGTHRLLGKDVEFRNLGLLIVDEEQRFGVTHKEKIQNYKTQVDVLTLSATPIPRTLHMSMIGVRDMSVLATPPEERFPVQTYVMEYDDGLIRDALSRELNRGGQAYFLYNRVESIERFAAHLRSMLPEARIAVAHGQMDTASLENVMLDFYDGRLDILLCSTIIENGLDVANANTLIVYEADRFGLSQLYQLRGRVGRSSRTAFAYFTVKKDKSLSETAQKRLDALRDFTAFGSGFRIAMRDLEIRGAGNIFGPEQSGNVVAVGYDLYCKMIADAVNELMPGRAGQKKINTKMDLKINAFLPGDYVSDDQQRMEVFRRIAAIATREDVEDVLDELIDRYGEVPGSVVNLIYVAYLRSLCGGLGISRVSSASPGTLTFRLEECEDIAALYQAMMNADRQLVFSSGKTSAIELRRPGKSLEALLQDAASVMEKVTEELEKEKRSDAV